MLCPDAITISGSKPIIVSASGFKKSICGNSVFIPSISVEYLSIATSLSPKPNAINTSVFEGAVDIIFSILVGIFTSVPSLSVTILSV